MAEASGPSLHFGVFLLLSLPLCVRASVTRVMSTLPQIKKAKTLTISPYINIGI